MYKIEKEATETSVGAPDLKVFNDDIAKKVRKISCNGGSGNLLLAGELHQK